MKLRLFSLLFLFSISACHHYSGNKNYSVPSLSEETITPDSNVAPLKKDEPAMNTEQYDLIVENDFRSALKYPLSTFGIDVDNASYSNSRRFLMQGTMPPRDAVRIEEFINYFDYDYPQPEGEHPFTVNTEISECPWNTSHRLVHIGLQARDIQKENMPPANLVFLIDVSGSMEDPYKLPLLKNAFKLLVKELRAEDRIAIVVYAGASGVALPSTPGSEKMTILAALDELSAGGSTAGAEGIHLAYKIAEANFIEKGNNRVILATDGDFNVGQSSDSELVQIIEKKRDKGIFLSIMGFGSGNYKDAKMEKLADNGNGNYAYIDNISEARKVLVNEITSTLFTIAKDVKLQIEFNPTHVKEYRLIGYENRILNDEDFNDDKKDSGDLGAGHTVTALYEIVPAGSDETMTSSVDELKYQDRNVKTTASADPDLMNIKLRYKAPDADVSKLLELTARDHGTKLDKTSDNFRFSAAVAGFAMLLRNSKYKGNTTYESVEELAQSAKGVDVHGYRNEFLSLIELSKVLAREDGMTTEH